MDLKTAKVVDVPFVLKLNVDFVLAPVGCKEHSTSESWYNIVMHKYTRLRYSKHKQPRRNLKMYRHYDSYDSNEGSTFVRSEHNMFMETALRMAKKEYKLNSTQKLC